MLYLQSIQEVGYEDELDLLVITAVHQSDENLVGTVYLHNNATGEILKEITLEHPWNEVSAVLLPQMSNLFM